MDLSIASRDEGEAGDPRRRTFDPTRNFESSSSRDSIASSQPGASWTTWPSDA